MRGARLTLPASAYAPAVVGVTFIALLISAGLRATPGVIMIPLELAFGWERATISLAAAIGILFYGLVGPFAAGLMQSFGIKRTMLCGLALMSASTFASQWMTEPWHYVLSWGVLSGIGSGAVASVLGAAVVNRWFATRQGLVMGMLSAATATGALVFLPLLAWLASAGAWRPVVLTVSLACAILLPIVAWIVPEHPGDVGTRRFGESGAAVAAPPRPPASPMLALSVLARAMRVPAFWLLFGTFLVCGLTTNGLVGTHMIAFCGDHGIAPIAAAGLLSLMGFFDLIGTTASGWLTDRYDPKKLLVVYYGLRGLSLMALPSVIDLGGASLTIFAIFYGLDWIATVPPTLKLTNLTFGERDAPIVFGWVMVGHQIGAAIAAFGAGLIRTETGSYTLAFVIAGVFAVAAALVLMGGRRDVRGAAAA